MVSCEVDARFMRSIPEDKVPMLRQGAGGERRVRWRLVTVVVVPRFAGTFPYAVSDCGVSSAFPAGAASGWGAVRNPER